MTGPRPGGKTPVAIRAGGLRLVEFSAADADTLYRLRNDPTVRCGMGRDTAIDRDAHRRYVADVLLVRERPWLFIARKNGEPFGLTLLRDFTDDAAEIGVMVVDAPSRRLDVYFVAHMTAWFGFDRLGLRRLVSKVPRHNAAALAFNRKCGFEDTGRADEEYLYLEMTLARYRDDPVHQRFRRRRPVRFEDPRGG